MKENRATHLVGYFNVQVLAAYRSEPDKYVIETDDFHGTISVTDGYFRQLQTQDKSDDVINVRFGYRTLDNGEVAIAAFMPDLVERSGAHVRRWSAFHLPNPIWSSNDERFEKWVRRYLSGECGVKSGPLWELRKAINTVNAITFEAVGIPLFADGVSATLPFPPAENTHRYEDAHAELYRYFIDGLDKECIERLGQCLGRPINAKSEKTVQALKKALPQLADATAFNAAFDLVSTQRRKADHKARPTAQSFPAFEQFFHGPVDLPCRGR